MKYFSRPLRAIYSASQIPVGTRCWAMLGGWQPRVIEEFEILSAPEKLLSNKSEHFDRSRFVRVSQIKSDGSYMLVNTKSLRDANIDCDNTYNDNYWFLSKKDAEGAARWFTLLYQLNPALYADEMLRYSHIDDIVDRYFE